MLKLFKFDLHLFDGGAEGGAAPASAPSTGSSEGNQSNTQGETKVVYGKVPTAEGEATTTNNPAAEDNKEQDRKAQFDQFIKDNKDLFTEKFNDTYNKRHKADKQQYESLMQKLNSVSPVINTLMDKYKVNDVNALAQAIDNDERLWEDEALEAGMTNEQYRMIQKLKRDSEQKDMRLRQFEAQRKADEQYNTWLTQAEALKVKYPDFNLDVELQNPEFRSLITTKNGDYAIPMDKAYELIHMDDILSNATIQAKDEVKKQVTDNIRARGARPKENGVNASNGVVYKNDVSKLTKAERADIARRAARGEVITFD